MKFNVGYKIIGSESEEIQGKSELKRILESNGFVNFKIRHYIFVYTDEGHYLVFNEDSGVLEVISEEFYEVAFFLDDNLDGYPPLLRSDIQEIEITVIMPKE